MMICLRTLALCALATTAVALGQQDTSRAVRIEALHKNVSSGKDIYIRLYFTNTSNLDLPATGPRKRGVDILYKYECETESGISVSKDDKGALEGVGDMPTIKPGETHEELIPINRACDVQQAGDYKITVSRILPADSTHEEIAKSNTITITVSPAHGPVAGKP